MRGFIAKEAMVTEYGGRVTNQMPITTRLFRNMTSMSAAIKKTLHPTLGNKTPDQHNQLCHIMWNCMLFG